MEKLYVVIDTNILVSALLKIDSYPGKVVSKIFENRIIPLVNHHIFEEYEEVLKRDKFRFNEKKIIDFLIILKEYCIYIDAKKLNDKFIDDSDKVFYEVYKENSKKFKTYLITGNLKHFPDDENIISPKKFIENIIK